MPPATTFSCSFTQQNLRAASCLATANIRVATNGSIADATNGMAELRRTFRLTPRQDSQMQACTTMADWANFMLQCDGFACQHCGATIGEHGRPICPAH